MAGEVDFIVSRRGPAVLVDGAGCADRLDLGDAIAREDNVIGTLRGCAGAVDDRNVVTHQPVTGADALLAGGGRIGDGPGRGGSAGTRCRRPRGKTAPGK